MSSNHLILYRPLLLPPSIFPSIRVFSNELVLHITWPKYWSFSFNISTSNEHPGLISFRMDWVDLLAVQGTLKSLLQFKSIKYSVLNFLYSPTLTSIQEKGKSNLQWGANLHWSEWPSSKNLQTVNAGEGVEKREFSCIVDGNVNWYSHLENSMEIPLNISKNGITSTEYITEKTMIQKDTCAKHHQHEELRIPSTSVLHSQHLIKRMVTMASSCWIPGAGLIILWILSHSNLKQLKEIKTCLGQWETFLNLR